MATDDKTRIASPDTVGQGTQLNGIYEIDERVAFGGMGEVYRGHNIQTGDPVAIKIVLPEFARDESILALFRKEASILNHLSHDAIVRYHVFSIDPAIGRPYLAMEYVDGVSVAERMVERPFDPLEARRLLARVASGLALAHEAGVIHRDLSPDNIILPGGNVNKSKIIDFGIARSANVGGGTLLGGKFAGKYNFVSPEQLGLFGGEVTERSDIYSLGLVIAGALRGEAIDMSGSQVEVIEKRRSIPDLSDLDESLRPMLEAMLQPDPRSRPESASDIVEWLRATGERSVPPSASPSFPGMPPAAFPASGLQGGPGYGVSQPPQYSTPPTASQPPYLVSQPPLPGSQPPLPGSHPPPASHPPHPVSQPPLPGSVPPHPGSRPPQAADWQGSVPPALPAGPAASVPPHGSAPPQYSLPPARSLPPDQGTRIADPSLPPSPSSHGSHPPQPASASYPPQQPAEAAPAPVSPAAVASRPPPNVLPPRNPAPGQPVRQRRRSPVVPILFGLILLALAGGAGAYFAGLFDPAPSQSTDRPVLTPPTEDVAEETPEPPPPVEEEAAEPPDEPAVDLAGQVENGVAFIRAFDGGPCFFAAPTAITDSSVQIEGYATSAAPFERLLSAYEAEFGITPDIGVRLVSAEQCPVVDFMRAYHGEERTNPEVTVSVDRLRLGDTLRGQVGGYGGRSVDLMMVSSDGIVQSLAPVFRDDGSFSFSLVEDPAVSGGQRPPADSPNLIVAMASPGGLQGVQTHLPNLAQVFFPAILGEISALGDRSGVDIAYFILGE